MSLFCTGSDMPEGQSSSSDDAHWEQVERTVFALERLIAPGAEIRHNQRLPELGTGTLRQCDVTIRTGMPPRQTLTIVEVQDRGRNVDLPTYEGWCSKREKLGAQHLICVSTSGFPESIQRDAALRGGTVRLVTLLEGQPPPFFKTDTILLQVTVLDRDIAFPCTRVIPGLDGQPTNAKIFSVDGSSDLQSAWNIAERESAAGKALDLSIQQPSWDVQIRRYRLDLAAADNKIWFDNGFGREQITEMLVTERVKRVNHSIPIKFLAYEQIGFGPTLAWVLQATGCYESHEFTDQMTVRRNEEGRIVVSSSKLSIPGLEGLSESVELLVSLG